MKKIFILLMGMCSIGFTKANPIIPPPVISEFYLVDSSHWYLELVFPQFFCSNLTSLDGCKITTSTGSFYFKNGIQVTLDSIIVITQDSLQSPLQINRKGDFITIETSCLTDRMYFGNISGSQISAPAYGQSIVNYADSCWSSTLGHGDIVYHLIKDNHPTIGYSPFYTSSSIGTFSGIVYDKGHYPVPGIHIGDRYYYIPYGMNCENFFASTLSNAAGKFTMPEYSGKYPVQLFFQYSRILYSSNIDIEPDSINYYEFTIDTLLTNVNSNSFQKDISLSCFPNPSTGETTISFGMPAGGHYAKALIKIYNSNSEMVHILPVSIGSSQNKYSIKWDGLCYDNLPASGVYFCTLELDGQKVATDKIIFAK